MQPYFGIVQPLTHNHKPSEVAWRKPELLGRNVEIVERRDAEINGQQGAKFRLHECDGGEWLLESDIEIRQSQKGRFFYGALCAVGITVDSSPSSAEIRALPPGTVLEAAERRVVEGVLRVRVVADTLNGSLASGWASEYRNAVFDPRLGGAVQLMRVCGPPPAGAVRGMPRYAFPR